MSGFLVAGNKFRSVIPSNAAIAIRQHKLNTNSPATQVVRERDA
ncbi:hypothetical protein AB1L42_17645 [Thalassoglobus sp. JC818]